MKRKLLLLLELSSFLFFIFFISRTESKNETIIKVPYKTSSSWQWSWTGQWTKQVKKGEIVHYTACDVSSQQKRWVRSDVFLDCNASRIDVTVQYSAVACSSISLGNCKQNLTLFVYKASGKHDAASNLVPEPSVKPEVYQLFGTTSPTNLITGSPSRNKINIETYSFITNSTTPYHYLAIQYQGGCFALYSVTISYSVCPSLALPFGLIQLPRTMAPVNGSIQVSGLCAANAQSLANNITLYGDCKANGEWSGNGECWCNKGFGKYLNFSGAYCNECPGESYQDEASGKACKPCPLNSLQDVGRRKCNCAPSFYRTQDESISDNCTECPSGSYQDKASGKACKPCPLNSVQDVDRRKCQTSAPQNINSTFVNASFVAIEWTTPLDLGGRSDVYYEVECNKCKNESKNCNWLCTNATVTHTPKTSRKATVQYLSAYTYYQFKVFAKNGVSHLAEKNSEKSKYAVGLMRTKESVPGAPVLKIIVLSSTAIVLRWTLPEPNGVIINYQVSYYPVDGDTKKTVLNTTENSTPIAGLNKETKYLFQVRAATRVGLGPASTQELNRSQEKQNDAAGSDGNKTDVTVPVLSSIVALLLVIGCVAVVFYILRRRGLLHRNENPENKQKDVPVGNVHHQTIILEDMPGETDDNYAYVLDDTLWEVPRKNLSVIKRLGSGSFGCVDKAIAIGLYGHPGQVTVAVKTLKENAGNKDKEDFLTELQLMMKLERHPRVVELLGCCTKSGGPMTIILEYLPYGDLLGYLRRSRGHEDTYCSGDLRPEGKLTSRDLLQFAWMIADGMNFLAQNKCVHRDLAARNVLVGENKMCKISDLGLARTVSDDVYTRSKAARLPIKWMPPESLFHGQSSIASDVWSYGIVLWEIFTLGDSPYPKYKGKDIPRLLQQGYRMPKPLHLSKTLYSLMLRCWQDKPEERPGFSLICDEISTYYNATQDYINLDVFEDALYVNFDVL